MSPKYIGISPIPTHTNNRALYDFASASLVVPESGFSANLARPRHAAPTATTAMANAVDEMRTDMWCANAPSLVAKARATPIKTLEFASPRSKNR